MEELKVGASYLRQLNSEALAKLDQRLVICAEGVPVAVVVPWAEHERLVGLAPVVMNRSVEIPEELKHQVAKVLAGIEHLLELESMMEAVVRHVVEAPSRGSAVERSFEEGGVFAPYSTATGGVIHADQQAAARPPFQSVRTQACRHCGGTFGGPRTATICSECKSTGHTNEPGECPRCTEGKQI